jgi:hypothetical protein
VSAGSSQIKQPQNKRVITMKKLTSLLIGCSLTLAGAALAQQPVEQQSPSKKAHATQTQPAAVTKVRTKSNQSNERNVSPTTGVGIVVKPNKPSKRQMPGNTNEGAGPAQTPSGKHAVNNKGTGANRQSSSPAPSR